MPDQAALYELMVRLHDLGLTHTPYLFVVGGVGEPSCRSQMEVTIR
jgi:hypothetical protein